MRDYIYSCINHRLYYIKYFHDHELSIKKRNKIMHFIINLIRKQVFLMKIMMGKKYKFIDL